MVQNNKVLTVSYGTFSCTLEGFEDSFDTMKAIAEYFRDLAADDRYFGAEPPQPDADMLARIAQREITRQVEARTSSEGIHLRAATPPAAEAAPAPAPVPAAAPVEEAVVEAAPVEAAPAAPAEEAAAPAEAPAEAPVEPLAEPEAETVVEEAAVEDAVVEEAAAEEAVVEVVEEAAAEAAPQDDSVVEAVAAELADETAAEADEDGTPAEEEVEAAAEVEEAEEAAADEDADEAEAAVELAGIEAALAAEPVEAEVVEAEAEEDAPAAELEPEDGIVPAADSIAAKLQRIRAVVAQAPSAEDEEFSEDEHAESIAETAAAEITEVLQAEDDAAALDDEDQDQDDDEIARALERLDLGAPVQEEDGTADAVAEEETAEDLSEAREDSLFGDSDAGALAGEDEAGGDDDAELNILQGEDSAGDDDDADGIAAARKPFRARIAKIKRATLDKAVSDGDLEEVSETPQEAAAEAPAPVSSSLSQEDEDDLMRELAAVEAELLAGGQDDEISGTGADAIGTDETEAEDDAAEVLATAGDDEEDAGLNAADAIRPAPESPDSDVSRLMAAADEKLGDPEAASSRETYNQLRAAVAAAQADGSANGSGDSSEAYREDLANVVRPRRPEARHSQSPRPRSSASRPAPLKLVAEQRIDAETAQPVDPVRPRRVSASVLPAEPAGDDGGFAAYASEQGADELHDLLEAAAAYMSFVEGRGHFSRPQLINKVRGVEGTEFNREDGLRCFGQLLRDGKIERAGNGRFTVSSQIGFQPSEREAG